MTEEPIIITKHGEGRSVVIPLLEYNLLKKVYEEVKTPQNEKDKKRLRLSFQAKKC